MGSCHRKQEREDFRCILRLEYCKDTTSNPIKNDWWFRFCFLFWFYCCCCWGFFCVCVKSVDSQLINWLSWRKYVKLENTIHKIPSISLHSSTLVTLPSLQFHRRNVALDCNVLVHGILACKGWWDISICHLSKLLNATQGGSYPWWHSVLNDSLFSFIEYIAILYVSNH